MRAIYIHIVADALGSVSVLISSFFIEYLGWNFTDPLCSILISTLIIYSSYPVLVSSFKSLSHINEINNKSKEEFVEEIVQSIEKIIKEIQIKHLDVYQLNSETTICEFVGAVNYEKTFGKMDTEEKAKEYNSLIRQIKDYLRKFDISEENSFVDLEVVFT